MRYLRNVWHAILIFLFMGFVVSMVFGTSRSEITEVMQQAAAVNHY